MNQVGGDRAGADDLGLLGLTALAERCCWLILQVPRLVTQGQFQTSVTALSLSLLEAVRQPETAKSEREARVTNCP